MNNRYILNARLSERKFKQLLKMFCTDIPALSASKLLGINRHTGQRFCRLLRKRTLELAVTEAKPFTGEVEIDESYFGPRRVRGRRGRGAARKTPVIGLLKRGGKVFTGLGKNCSRAELEPVIKGQVLSRATVYTDGWLGYDGLVPGGYKHRRIYHHDNEFARGKIMSTASKASGVMPSSASSSCVVSDHSSSSSTSKNPSGVGIIAVIISIQSYSKTSAFIRSNLGKTPSSSSQPTQPEAIIHRHHATPFTLKKPLFGPDKPWDATNKPSRPSTAPSCSIYHVCAQCGSVP